MVPECGHVKICGRKCSAPALRGTPYCYFHTKLHNTAKQKPNPMDSIEIPVIEDRCAIQVAIAQVLKALISKSIDNQRASILLRGLRLAAQNVDRTNWAIPIRTINALTRTRDGDEIGQELTNDEYDDDDDEDDDDSE